MVQENSLTQKPLLLIVGCTASGKSALAMSVAKKLNTDIISCDSMQIYRGMDIGTAKPTKAEQKDVKHHMIDIVDIDENFTAAKYVDKVNTIINNIKTPLIVGGTGLYVNSLLFSYNFADAEKSKEVRVELENMLNEKGNEYMYSLLKSIDPISAAETHPNNTARVLRAIEIFKVSGKTKSSMIKKTEKSKMKYLAFDIDIEREELYTRINSRVDLMIEQGLFDEVDGILKNGYKRDIQSLSAIGYKEAISYLYGEISKEDCINLIKQNTRHYAKRQITWFKRLDGVEHITGSNEDMANYVVKKYLAIT